MKNFRHHVPSRPVSACALLAAAAMVLTACSGGNGSDQNGNVATVALTAGEAPTYILPSDPDCTATNHDDLRALLYRPLYWYGGIPGKEFERNDELSLAEPPVYSKGDTQVSITLKDYTWSDGKPVTSKDLEFYFDLYSASKKDWGCYSPGSVPDNIKKVQVKDDKTVVLTLDQRYAPTWFTVNALADIAPMPEHVWDKTSADGKVGDYASTPSGAKKVFDFLTEQAKSPDSYDSNPLWGVVDGPWKLQKFDPRGDIDFVPNKNYSGPDKPKLAKLVERRFTTDQAEFDALLSDQSITTGYIPSQDASRKRQVTDQGFTVYQQGNFGINYITLNYHSNQHGPLFNQLYIRQALQHMIDEPTYVKVAYNGNAEPVNGPVPIKPANPYASAYEKSVPYPYDPGKAVALLKQHGWTVKPDGVSTCARPGSGANQCGAGIAGGDKLQFTLDYSKDVSSDRSMQAFQSSAAKAGIKIALRAGTFDHAVSITNDCKRGSQNCNWDAVGWGGWHFGPYPTGEDLFATGACQCGYSDPKTDKLVAATKTKGGQRAMTEYEDYVARTLPYLWLPRAQGGLNVVRSDLKGYDRDKQSLFGYNYPQYWHF